MKFFKNNSLSRLTILVILLLAVSVLTPFMSYLSTVFGWTNPSQNPPGGSGLLTRSGNNLGVNTASPSTTLTINGQLSVSGNRIRDVATPVAGTDAVNKDYVQAQGQGGPPGGLGAGVMSVTLYGVSSAAPAPTSQFRPGGAIPACLRGVGGVNCLAINAPVAAGTGTPACTSLGTGWSEVYAGFGPFNALYFWYNNIATGEEVNEHTTPSAATGLSDSICSTASFAFVNDRSYLPQGSTNTVYQTQSVVTACTPTQCNTCRVCKYEYSTSTP